jgi:mRNA interferase RelE/StbE
MEARASRVPHNVEIGPKAEKQLAELDAAIAASIERKILWLAENAEAIVHRRLVGMPEDLEGLCKLRVGDYRILYWIYPQQRLVRLYRIAHRSDVYRHL